MPRALLVLATVTLACAGEKPDPAPPGDQQQPEARFISSHYVDLDAIEAISRFRSGVGHDYSDGVEACRSMKHYLRPRADVDWSTVELRSPVAGTIVRRIEEWAGAQLWIRSESRPEVEIRIFHVQPAQEWKEGDHLEEGERLGTHIGDQTMSDVAVGVYGDDGQLQLVSFFELLTDEAFALLQARGVASRETLVISAAERDADPLDCDGGEFGPGTIENWVTLEPAGP